MNQTLEQLVRERARENCEYCQLPQQYTSTFHQMDHIIAIKHRGPTIASNLALACLACNNHKGPCIAGIDPVSSSIVRLYHPRLHKWSAHFRWEGPVLVGRTTIARATIVVLEINLRLRVSLRAILIEDGLFPPSFEIRQETS
jgi:hypothetical protein